MFFEKKEEQMNTKETLKVYIEFKGGKTVCICMRSAKGCRSRHCIKDCVTRDMFEDVKGCFEQNRFGK